MYKVLARKYRPTKLSEVIGQSVAVTILKNAIETGKLHHAILLYGPMGVGKTSLARIIAKSLNCEQGPTVNPCNNCEACVSISQGKDVDVIEIDGASNRKIENARNIIESVKYPPLKRRFKIYIIDEVHMFTMEAFNAMLKTIEEPPGYVKFIFATTAIEKVPDTILSRCQILSLKKIPQADIVRKLAFIAKEENLSIEPEAIELIAYASNGSLRVAEGYLDRCIAYKPRETITKMDVSLIIGIPTKDIVKTFVDDILNGRSNEAIATVKSLEESSVNLETFNRMILEELLNRQLPLEIKTALINIFYKSLIDIKQKVDSADALIVAIVKSQAAKNLEKIEEAIERVTSASFQFNLSQEPVQESRAKTEHHKIEQVADETADSDQQSNVDLILNTFGGKIISVEKN